MFPMQMSWYGCSPVEVLCYTGSWDPANTSYRETDGKIQARWHVDGTIDMDRLVIFVQDDIHNSVLGWLHPY